MRIFVVVLVAIVTPIAVPALADDDGDARVLIQKCIAAQTLLDRSSMKLETAITLDYPDDRPKKQRTEAEILRNGEKIDLQGEYLFLDKVQDSSYHFHAVVNDDYYIEYQTRRKKKHPLSGLASKAGKAQKRNTFLETCCYSGPLDGYATNLGGKRISERLLDATDLHRKKPESLDGTLCEVVEGQTRYGKMTAWIAPSQGDCCVRFVVERTGNDRWTDDKAISALPPFTTSANISDQRPITRVLTVLDNVRVGKVDDHFVPLEGRFTESIFRQGGSTIVNQCVYRRSDIHLGEANLKPDAYQIDLPAGTPINFLDDARSGVRYNWTGSEVVAAFGPDQGGPVTFLAGKSTAQWFVVINGLVLVGIAVSLYLGRSRKPQESSGREE